MDGRETCRHALAEITFFVRLIGDKTARQSIGENELPRYRHDGFVRPDPFWEIRSQALERAFPHLLAKSASKLTPGYRSEQARYRWHGGFAHKRSDARHRPTSSNQDGSKNRLEAHSL